MLLRPVSSRYFDVLGIPVLRGSMFEPNTTNEAVVNEAFVRAYWPGENVVGQAARHVDRVGGVRRSYTIVGVMRDTYLTGLEKVEPIIFTPAASLGTFLTRSGPASVPADPDDTDITQSRSGNHRTSFSRERA